MTYRLIIARQVAGDERMLRREAARQIEQVEAIIFALVTCSDNASCQCNMQNTQQKCSTNGTCETEHKPMDAPQNASIREHENFSGSLCSRISININRSQ